MDITGEQIKASRERQRMTQQELADEVGVSLRTVGSWERGETVPRNRMGAIAEALDIQIPGERDYGQQAIRRRLGVLAKQRREQLGLSRIAFAKHAGTFDQAVMDFEFAKRWPRSVTLRKFEDALGWKRGVTEQLLMSGRRASAVELEDLDNPAVVQPVGGSIVLAGISTADLLAELVRRNEAQEKATPAPATQNLFDLAASDDHVEGEDDRD
jgi:transcriptional regulator with XRE-family HTH domain